MTRSGCHVSSCTYLGRKRHSGEDCLDFSFQVPCMATYINTSIFIVEQTGKLHMRHCKIRDRSVLSNVYLNDKCLDPDVIYLPFSGRKRHSGEDCPGFSFQVSCTATYLKTSILIVEKTGKLHMRLCEIRDRSVLPNVYLSYK